MAKATLCTQIDYDKLPAAPLSGTIIPGSTRTFRDAVNSYLTHGGESRYLDKITAIIGDRPLSSIVPFDVRELATHLYPDASNATRNRQVITPVRAVMHHAYDRGWAPLVRLRNLKTDAPVRKKAASPAWLHAFTRQCEQDDLPHLAALVLFMSQTGARVSEAIRLTWEHVDLVRRTALLTKTKTGSNSTRFLTDQLVDRLHRLNRQSAPQDRVFRYTSRLKLDPLGSEPENAPTGCYLICGGVRKRKTHRKASILRLFVAPSTCFMVAPAAAAKVNCPSPPWINPIVKPLGRLFGKVTATPVACVATCTVAFIASVGVKVGSPLSPTLAAIAMTLVRNSCARPASPPDSAAVTAPTAVAATSFPTFPAALSASLAAAVAASTIGKINLRTNAAIAPGLSFFVCLSC